MVDRLTACSMVFGAIGGALMATALSTESMWQTPSPQLLEARGGYQPPDGPPFTPDAPGPKGAGEHRLVNNAAECNFDNCYNVGGHGFKCWDNNAWALASGSNIYANPNPSTARCNPLWRWVHLDCPGAASTNIGDCDNTKNLWSDP